MHTTSPISAAFRASMVATIVRARLLKRSPCCSAVDTSTFTLSLQPETSDGANGRPKRLPFTADT